MGREIKTEQKNDIPLIPLEKQKDILSFRMKQHIVINKQRFINQIDFLKDVKMVILL